MATMRDIKRRKSSIESTEQITKAMKLVATVKLQKSRTKAENSRLYFNLMYQTIQEMLKKSTGIRHRYLKSCELHPDRLERHPRLDRSGLRHIFLPGKPAGTA